MQERTAISKEFHKQIAAYLGVAADPIKKTFEDLIAANAVPPDLKWTPSLCLSAGTQHILVHLLETEEIPEYVVEAITEIASKGFSGVDIVVLADSIKAGGTGGKTALRSSWAAGGVAKLCSELGAGLQFIEIDRVVPVFPPRYKPPTACANADETGHIPSWIYKKLLAVPNFSPFLAKQFRDFFKTYSKATKGKSIGYDKETDLLRKLARDISKGDQRLFIPIGELDVLRQWERAGADKKSRDHFFHTFNNLFMGYLVLGSLKRSTDKILGAVDSYIGKDKDQKLPPKLAAWEALWLLTCLFHDPAYIAEKFHSGTFRFSYGVVEDESGFGIEIQEAQKEKINDLWDNEFAIARGYLGDLYDHTIRKWSLPEETPKSKEFDTALRKAYFDGTQCSHSVVSGIRLIQLCRHDRAYDEKRRKEPATRACVIAALAMMFHDQKCRDTLLDAGIQPFAFSQLPYTSVLMFVDALQDDRRDITRPRFPAHGILHDLEINASSREVRATICLPEVDFRYWSGRIGEYENVLSWVNNNSDTDVTFLIDYKSRAGLV